MRTKEIAKTQRKCIPTFFIPPL